MNDIEDASLAPWRGADPEVQVTVCAECVRVRAMGHKLYELDVRLQEIEPPIWRTIEVPGASSLEDVHFALQVAMGWTLSHLHQFKIGKRQYGMVEVDGAEDLGLEDERAFQLQDVARAGDTFVYEYDFGDGWEHAITVKKVTTTSKVPRPRCLAGARACPPEDSGGPHGYQHLLEVLADPKHPEHAESRTWADGFEPEQFEVPKDLGEAIEELRELADGDDEGVDLPKPLVDAVLALHPIQRASLAAVIAGSLADELEAAHVIIRKLAAQNPPRGHGGRSKRTRS